MTTDESNINHKYGYIRVSSKSQEFNSSIESQKKELICQGIPKKNLRVEIGSAADATKNRHIFKRLIEEELQKNDLLMVTRIDRCSRNTLEFLKLQDNLFQRSITFVALDIPHSNDLAVNKLIATSLSAIATFGAFSAPISPPGGPHQGPCGELPTTGLGLAYWLQKLDFFLSS